MKTVSLALGSGGARGLAHIGIIRWLEKNDFKITSIAGCSIGAVVGGVYAAGKLDEFEQWMRSMTKVDILTFMDFSWERSGLVRGNKLINTLIELVGDKLIEDLPISYSAVAADVKAQEEIWFKSGRLFDALRASTALPLLVTPFKYKKGVELIDGGVLNPLAISPTFRDGADLTIVVNLGGLPEENGEIAKKSAPTPSPSPIREKINRFISHLQPSTTSRENRNWGAYDVTMQAFDAMQNSIAHQKLVSSPPDIIIEISRNACSTFEFYRAAEMIELGYRKAEEQLSKSVMKKSKSKRVQQISV